MDGALLVRHLALPDCYLVLLLGRRLQRSGCQRTSSPILCKPRGCIQCTALLSITEPGLLKVLACPLTPASASLHATQLCLLQYAQSITNDPSCQYPLHSWSIDEVHAFCSFVQQHHLAFVPPVMSNSPCQSQPLLLSKRRAYLPQGRHAESSFRDAASCIKPHAPLIPSLSSPCTYVLEIPEPKEIIAEFAIISPDIAYAEAITFIHLLHPVPAKPSINARQLHIQGNHTVYSLLFAQEHN